MSMRKGAGLSALSRHTATTSSFSTLSTSLSASQLTSLETSLASFREALLTFSRQHRTDIRADPAFRHQFAKMCAVLGVDPLSGPTPGKGSGGGAGFWSGLGLGEWNYELAVQVVDVCVSTRSGNGGMIPMSELIRRVTKMRSGGGGPAPEVVGVGVGAISAEDVKRAIGLLKPLAGYSIVPIAGVDFVRSVSRELDTDQGTLLAAAAGTGGRLTERELRAQTGWSDVRARRALDDAVMREGLGWVDEQGPEWSVWLVPSVDFGERPQG